MRICVTSRPTLPVLSKALHSIASDKYTSLISRQSSRSTIRMCIHYHLTKSVYILTILDNDSGKSLGTIKKEQLILSPKSPVP